MVSVDSTCSPAGRCPFLKLSVGTAMLAGQQQGEGGRFPQPINLTVDTLLHFHAIVGFIEVSVFALCPSSCTIRQASVFIDAGHHAVTQQLKKTTRIQKKNADGFPPLKNMHLCSFGGNLTVICVIVLCYLCCTALAACVHARTE